MKKMIAMLLIVLTVAACCIAGALAATPIVQQTEYEGNGYVEVDFNGYVQYGNVNVIVKDADGNSYEVRIVELDDDDMIFVVSDPVPGLEYAYTISGVRSGWDGSDAGVEGTFTIPEAGQTSIKSLDYDREDRELEIEFTGRVTYRDPEITLQNAAGESFAVKLVEQDSDSVEVQVGKLPKGTYTVVVSGVAAKEFDNYSTLTGAFEVH